ncbi:MAG: YebC/PmpR family DNA-binding transcriptional regulator [Candidatus Carbobacillus altaicus]|uniref:Probable transcriptional regulatory protein BSOLF_0698 n=1 Tax=Candidatus Carbonibacillus altaicus TaxID=2163959 RepID=A0A2R6Y579_9BACL|nr:YebC/PmpR family DNA-binding transcriptional regulator [Candidatus Carbobacillus altaicus]PTQ57836.1 MAG: hypothetical protein BSOLF_0698 [Candidatus Carbobacillus altaicus]
MAGHSKWKNIQHRKGRQDAARAQKFTKVSKEIYAAAKNGGGNPDTNPQLKAAIQKARAISMPQDNIERTIKKALGEIGGARYELIVYEGYGPGGVAYLIEALTDNRNRTAAKIRHLFQKYGGSLGESGSANYIFEPKAAFVLDGGADWADEETLLTLLIEHGGEEMETTDGETILYAPQEAYAPLLQALTDAGYTITRQELVQLPTVFVPVSGEVLEQNEALLAAFEEEDDVQEVYTNFEPA